MASPRLNEASKSICVRSAGTLRRLVTCIEASHRNDVHSSVHFPTTFCVRSYLHIASMRPEHTSTFFHRHRMHAFGAHLRFDSQMPYIIVNVRAWARLHMAWHCLYVCVARVCECFFAQHPFVPPKTEAQSKFCLEKSVKLVSMYASTKLSVQHSTSMCRNSFL